MQQIVIDQPYKFVPPQVNRLWLPLIRLWLPWSLRREFGLVGIETVGAERLRSSLDAGHGVLVASNHSRNSDPLVLGCGIDRETGGKPAFMMGGWHIFKQHPVQRYLLPRVGSFSIYREGTDRKSLRCATGILARGDGPLSMFPEGYISHRTDRLAPLKDGVSFIARVAAKQRRAEKRAGGIVIQPTFIRYFFDGDLEQTVDPVLGEIEERLTWQNQAHLPMVERIERIGEALLAQRELEHLGTIGSGNAGKRVAELIEHMLGALEKEWPANGGARLPMARVQRLRGSILAGMVDGSKMPASERGPALAPAGHPLPGPKPDQPTGAIPRRGSEPRTHPRHGRSH